MDKNEYMTEIKVLTPEDQSTINIHNVLLQFINLPTFSK